MVEKTIHISNPSGLHAKVAALFVQTAGKYSSNIWILKDSKKVNAKSIMGLMSLPVSQGSEITICAEGEDEDIAVRELSDFIKYEFMNSAV